MSLLPSGIIVGATGNNTSPTEKIGGTALGINSTTNTSNGKPITRTLTIRDTAMDGASLRASVPIELSGINHAYSTTKAYTSGTFAYKQSQFMIRTVATKINNVANSALSINGNEQHRVRRNITNKSKGAQTSTAWRSGYFRYLKISGQRSNWSTAPSSNNVQYSNGAGGNAADTAIFVTYRSVPGELTYMYGTLNPKQDDYKPITG